jgi:hypothetical protein
MNPALEDVLCKENREKGIYLADDGVYFLLKLRLEHCRNCDNYALINGAHYCRIKEVNE